MSILQGVLPTGPSSQSSASGALPSVTRASVPGLPAESDPAKLEKDRKEREKKEKQDREKREREARKNLQLSKAKSWAEGMVKNIGIAQTWINEIQRSSLPQDTMMAYKKRMTDQLDMLRALQLELEAAKTDDAAKTAVDKAAPAEISLKNEIKVWKKVHKALTEGKA